MSGTTTCSKCDGSGFFPMYTTQTCMTCNGTGQVIDYNWDKKRKPRKRRDRDHVDETTDSTQEWKFEHIAGVCMGGAAVYLGYLQNLAIAWYWWIALFVVPYCLVVFILNRFPKLKVALEILTAIVILIAIFIYVYFEFIAK